MNIITAVLRTGAQALVTMVAAWLVARGVDFPLDKQTWLVDGVIVTGGVAAYTMLVRWLETRTSPVLRALGRLLILGITSQPIYVKPPAGELPSPSVPPTPGG